MTMEHSDRLEYLKAQLRHVLPVMRFSAARALGELGDPQAIEFLLSALKHDPSPDVRRAATIALTELGVEVAESGNET